MNFKISSWAIRRPIPIIVLFLLLTVLGIRAFQGLPINADPDMRFPMVNITVTQTGASADELENTVTRRVEDAVAGMAGVRHITSTITEGSSVTAVEFRLETDTDRAVNDVRNAITQIRGNLPQNIDNPVVERMDTEGGALGYYAVQSPNMNQTELSWFIDDAVSRELLAVNGVQQVKRLRPILMTTIAMVAGMVPAVFASGAGAAFRAPMAIAVICGLTASTLLSLVFVPVVYSLMDDLRKWLAPKLAKLTSVTVEDRARK